MGRFVFLFITEIHNLTDHNLVSFRVEDFLYSIKDLPPGKNRKVKLSRILQRCRDRGSSQWKIAVYFNGVFTGMEMTASHILHNARILIKREMIEVVPEKKYIDYLLRDRYLGSMRKKYWDKRPTIQIASIQSRVASNLSEIEVPCDVQLAALARIPFQPSEIEAPFDLETAPLARVPSLQREMEAPAPSDLWVPPLAHIPPLQREMEAPAPSDLWVPPLSRIPPSQREMEAPAPSDLWVPPLNRIRPPQRQLSLSSLRKGHIPVKKQLIIFKIKKPNLKRSGTLSGKERKDEPIVTTAPQTKHMTNEEEIISSLVQPKGSTRRLLSAGIIPGRNRKGDVHVKLFLLAFFLVGLVYLFHRIGTSGWFAPQLRFVWHLLLHLILFTKSIGATGLE